MLKTPSTTVQPPSAVVSHFGTVYQTPTGYSDRLYNEDLAPLVAGKERSNRQDWNWYNIFAFWMSDVHSVGGYVFAGSLFALGIQSWQVLLALIVGIMIVQVLCNLVAKPSQQAGVPYPVVCHLAYLGQIYLRLFVV